MTSVLDGPDSVAPPPNTTPADARELVTRVRTSGYFPLMEEVARALESLADQVEQNDQAVQYLMGDL
jgi:hypothetical protein